MAKLIKPTYETYACRVRTMMEAARGRGWTVHAPPLRDQWGVHHSKAFLVESERGLRVIVMTANLIFQDCNLKTQGLWYQDFPRRAAHIRVYTWQSCPIMTIAHQKTSG